MPEETQYLSQTPVKADGYLEKDWYRIRCRCLRCGHEYSRVYKTIPKKDPPCPKRACKEALIIERAAKQTANVNRMIETGETPGHIGENINVKAIDQTAEIVMQDYGMTDLKDNTRPGESMAPSLTPRQREMSKNFWGGGSLKDRKRDPTYQLGVQAHKKSIVDKAMSGAYIPNVAGAAPADSRTGDTVLRAIHGAKYKPPVELIYDTKRAPKK